MIRYFIGAFGLVLAAMPLRAAAPASVPLEAIALLQPGQWQLRAQRLGAESRALCLADTRALLQIRHAGASCSRFVISSTPREATVHYTCPGAGHGRTTIRVETPRLVQIESQGIAENAPFAITYEGRRIGDCAARENLSAR